MRTEQPNQTRDQIRLLVVGEDEETHSFFQKIVTEIDCQVITAPGPLAAIRHLEHDTIDVVFADLAGDDSSVDTIVTSANRVHSRPQVIATVDDASGECLGNVLKCGAFDCLAKPFHIERFRLSLRRVLEYRRLALKLARLSREDIEPRAAGHERPLSVCDAVTELPNRTALVETLEEAIVRQRVQGGHVALIAIGVDNLPAIVIAEGACRVDAMLHSLSARLRGELFERDTLAHIGPGELALVMELRAAEEIDIVVDKVNRILAVERESDALRYSRISLSAGIALFPMDGTTTQMMYDRAITALYTQQQQGGAGYQFFQSEKKRVVRKNAVLESRLRKAVSNNALDLVVQPYHRLVDDAPYGGEVLLRWNDEELGDVPPNIFVPVLEQSRLIIPVTEWIVEAIARLQDTLGSFKPADFHLSFNVSPMHLQCSSDSANLVGKIMDKLKNHDNVVVEITESTFISNSDRTIRTLQRLKDIGVKVAIDDFGTGYSSMSYLVQFGFDLIKVDREFVSTMHVNSRVETIVSTIISMAQKLGIGTVAEGVETASQKTALRDLGCDLAQGYHYSKPIPIHETVGYLSGSGV